VCVMSSIAGCIHFPCSTHTMGVEGGEGRGSGGDKTERRETWTESVKEKEGMCV